MTTSLLVLLVGAMWPLGCPCGLFTLDGETDTCCVAPRSSSTPSAGAILSKGLWEAWNGQLDPALNDLNLAIERGADKARALAARGWVYMAKKQYDSALIDFSESLKLQPEQAWVLKHRATLFLVREELDKAILDLLRAKELDDNDAEILVQTGMIYLMSGKPERAIETCLEAIARDCHDPSVSQILICAYASLHKWDKAFHEADNLLAKDPLDPLALALKALIHFRTRNVAQAIVLVSKGIDAHPDDVQLYLVRGECYLCSSAFEEAIRDFRKVLDLAPENLQARVNLSLAYSWLQQWDNAMEILRPAERKGGFADQLAFARGIWLSRKGRNTEAIPQLTKAIAFLERADRPTISNPKLAHKGATVSIQLPYIPGLEDWKQSIYLERAYVYGRLKRFGDAFADIDKAIAVDPLEAEPYVARARVHSKMGNFVKAIEDCDRALERDPRAASAYLIRGSAYEKNGQHDLALVNLAAAAKFDPKNPETYRRQYLVHLSMGQVDRAVDDCTQALCLEPQNALNFHCRGYCYLRGQEWLKALDDLNQALSLEPASPDTLLNRSAAYSMLSKPESALADLNKAIRLAPQKAELFQARAHLNYIAGNYARTLEDIDTYLKLGGKDPEIVEVRDWILKARDWVLRVCDAISAIRVTTTWSARGDGSKMTGIDRAAAQDSELPSDVCEIKSRSFRMPLTLDGKHKDTIEGLRLFVSYDLGKTWKHQDDYKITDREVTFFAPADGLYWFGLQVLGKDGKCHPAKLEKLDPVRKVYVNTEGKPFRAQKSYEELQNELDKTIKRVEELERKFKKLESDQDRQ